MSTHHRPDRALGWLLLLALASPLAASELVVFLPHAPSQLAVQRALSADPACTGMTLTVVPKWRSLEEILARAPELVLAPSTFAVVPGWRAEAQAVVAGATWLRYDLVARDAAVRLDSVGQAAVGMLQELPRGEVDGFLATAFPGLAPGRTRLTAKADDVANLLGLELARAVVLTPDMSSSARARLGAAMHVVARSRPVWQARLFVAERLPPGRGHTLLHLRPETLAALGFDRLVPGDPALAPGWHAPEAGAP